MQNTYCCRDVYSQFNKVRRSVILSAIVQRLYESDPIVLQIPGGGVLPYMGYIGMCRGEGYGFQVVYSRVGYINQSIWV